jgi:hypothetical protein
MYFNKQKDGYIASGWFAISNKPSYASSNCKFDIKIRNDHVLQLLTYIDVYFFNLKLAPNCIFYPKFRQRFLEEKCGIQMIEARKQPQHIKEEQPPPPQQTENFKENEPVEISRKTTREEIPDISEAKIWIDEGHKTILKSQRKQVETLAAKYTVAIKLPDFADQKHLFVLGTIANQNSFQKELRELFFKSALVMHQERIEICSQLPKSIGKIAERIRMNLQSIKNTGIKETKRWMQAYLDAERKMDHKNVMKHRRSLNIAFMGFGELKDGAVHMKELRKILVGLEKDIGEGNGNKTLEQSLKDRLAGHLKYIFSPVDHGNYPQLFRNYKQALQQKNSNKKAKNH